MHLLRLVLLVAIAPAFFIQGCDSTSNEALPNSGVSLCINLYEMCVQPILSNPTATGATCSMGGCHIPPPGAAAGGFFIHNPASPAQTVTNFMQVEPRTLNNGLLLSKASGNSHNGGKQINVGDLCYNTIAEWSSIAAPTDGSACTATISTCALAAIPANILTCGQ